MAGRRTRSQSGSPATAKGKKSPQKALAEKVSKLRYTGKKRKAPVESATDEAEELSESEAEASDAYEEPRDVSEEQEDEALDSDALDEESDVDRKSKKRKRNSTSKKSPAKASTPTKKRKSNAEDDGDEFELEDGQELVGVVVQAPTTGRGTLHNPVLICVTSDDITSFTPS